MKFNMIKNVVKSVVLFGVISTGAYASTMTCSTVYEVEPSVFVAGQANESNSKVYNKPVVVKEDFDKLTIKFPMSAKAKDLYYPPLRRYSESSEFSTAGKEIVMKQMSNGSIKYTITGFDKVVTPDIKPESMTYVFVLADCQEGE